MEKYLQQFNQWLTLKNYSKKTRKCYLGSVKIFWRFCELRRKSDPSFEQQDAVQVFLLYRMEEQGRAWQTINGDYSALRLFFKNILNRHWDLRKLPRPRKERSLPKVISPEQVQKLIDHGVTFKHKVFFTLLYSTGLRLGEALRLRVEDVDVAGMQLRVLNGKGRKDRYTLLSAECLDMLRFYFRAFRPEGRLIFNGKVKGKPWSERAAQHAFIAARRRAGLPEYVTAHTLRHCFATHLLQSGIDLVTIQKLMGHKYIKTTARYIHLDHAHFTKIQNPADRIGAWEKVINSVKSSDNTQKNISTATSQQESSVAACVPLPSVVRSV